MEHPAFNLSICFVSPTFRRILTMSDVNSLLQRIDDEIAASEKKVKSFQAEQVEAYEGRQARLKTFEQVCEKLREIWRPRLEALAQKFGSRVKATPRVTPELREATFAFESNLANI